MAALPRWRVYTLHHTPAKGTQPREATHHTPLPNSAASHTLIYLDPARRSQSGGKVFRIEDCEPNVIELLPTLRAYAERIMIKFSPMLDITAALRALGTDWDTHVVAVNNEVKEVLFFTGIGAMHAVNIRATHTDRFVFNDEDEKNAPMQMAFDLQQYIYEPNAAIIKAGAFRLVGERYQLRKLDTHTHLYTSDTLLPDFPGRVWELEEIISKHSQLDTRHKYAILTRNYPLSPDQVRKKYKLKDGDDRYIIGVRHQGKARLILARRLSSESQ